MDYERFDRWMSENPQATGWLEWIMYPAMEHYATARIPTDIDMLTQMTHCQSPPATTPPQQTRPLSLCSVDVDIGAPFSFHSLSRGG